MKNDINKLQAPKEIKDLVFDVLMGDFPIAFYWTDVDGKLLGCNETELKLLGLSSAEEFVGKYAKNISTKKAWENSEKVLKENKAQIYEESFTDADGKKSYFYSVKKPLRDNTGKLVGLLGVAVDVSDRKKAEEYRIKHEAAQKVINFTNLMAGSIAHELRTPLTAIRVNMEALHNMKFKKMQPQVIGEAVRQITSLVIKDIDATSHVIEDMLIKIRSFATGEIQHSEFEELSIAADIENLLEKYPFENGKQELVKVLYGARFRYLGDKVLTAHVLSNLLRNALRAIKETHKTDADITIETKTEGDANLLIFRDTATGITKDFVSKIFDQFVTKTTTHAGTGLGLSFCKMVMEDCYGGSITCNSELGKYTEFVLSFPKIKAR